MPIQNPQNISLQDRKEIEAIIGSPPGWALRWGVSVLLIGFLVLLAFSHFIQYPDVVQAKAMLTTQNPPIRLAANADAKISHLLAANGQQVEKGELLAILDNPAKWEDVQKLQTYLEKMSDNNLEFLASTSLPSGLQLGSLQGSFARFAQAQSDLGYFLKQDLNYQKISNLRKQIAEILRLNESLRRQEVILQEEVALARNNMERDSTLLARNSLSRLEFEQSQALYLQKRRELESLRSGATQNSLRIEQIRGQMLDLEKNQSDDLSNRTLAFDAEARRLQGEIDQWKETWLIEAPISGEVALTQAWSEQQFVKKGEEMLTIVPNETAGTVFAKALLPYQSSGKVEPGMEAHLRLDGFPYQEYGMLLGKVAYISAVPGEMGYEMGISLPANLATNYNKPIPFRQEMQGTARIITEEKSLLSRLLSKIISAVKN
jgi:HlyD family secretion protein